jgi:hypothetical protein
VAFADGLPLFLKTILAFLFCFFRLFLCHCFFIGMALAILVAMSKASDEVPTCQSAT